MYSQPVVRLRVMLVLSALLCGGCVIENDKRDLSLQAATSAYQSAIRWGYFENAYGYVDPDLRAGKPLPPLYKNLRLTGYDVVQPPQITNRSKATQIVNIDYLFEDRQVMKSLTDHQVWRYDSRIKNWWLVSGLPAFK